MKNYIYAFFTAILALCFFQCKGQTNDNNNTNEVNTTNENYSFKAGSPDGIGKYYKDREIAHVMGFQGMNWLERPEREKEENTSKLIKNLGIAPDDAIADIGAGSGYHVFKIAPKVKGGLIYAVDIQAEMLQNIRDRNMKQGIDNIELVKGTEKSVNLPENSVDKILMVDVYHEFSFPVEMLGSLHKALRNGGKIYLIEYRGEDPSVPIKKLHKMTEVQAVKEFKANGFVLQENINNLPWQHCMVFVKE